LRSSPDERRTPPLQRLACAARARIHADIGTLTACDEQACRPRSLHRSGLHPPLPAGALAKPDGAPTLKAKKLVKEIKAVMREERF